MCALIPFKDTEEDEKYNYLTLFDDDRKGEGVLITPRWILRMGVDKGGLSWADIKFKLKTH